MFRFLQLFLSVMSAFLLIACLFPGSDTAELTRMGPDFGRGASCTSCHAYPPADNNHLLHLNKLDENATTVFKDKMTCYDCHGHSIHADTQQVVDTFFYGLWGEVLSGREYPGDTLLRQNGVAYIDTLWEYIPFYSPGADTSVEQPELQTGRAHMNWKVDVHMHSRNTDLVAVYDREALTCSAVACHTDANEPYPAYIKEIEE